MYRSKKIKFSVIIPVKEINNYVREFVPIILKQPYKNFEIIILPDKRPKTNLVNVKIIPTGQIGPAQKRDIGAKKAAGEILAFIDDDAYPDKNWFFNALRHFDETEVAAVGGPNLTPPDSNHFQKLSGNVLSSFMVSGPQRHRYLIGKSVIEDYDLPSCNFFVRKKVFNEIGGFNTGFWPGEDTKLCLDIKNLGKRILYDPKIIVYHYRRKNLKGYVQQIFTYSKHRGFFAKKYPETSLKVSYFVPSLFLIGLVLGSFAFFLNYYLRLAYLLIITIYLIALFVEAFKSERIYNLLPFVALAFLTHLTYGFGFILGMLKKNLASIYRK